MKILMVSRMPTHPHEAGNRQRVFRECEALKKMGHEVDFLFLDNILSGDIGAMREYFGKEHFYRVYPEYPDMNRKIRDRIRKILDRHGISKVFALKYTVDEWFFEKLGGKVKELHDRNHYDVIWIQYMMYSKLFEYLEDDVVLKVIDTQDRYADRHRLFQKKKMVPQYYYTSKREERKGLSRADVVLSIQDKEEEFFSKLLKNKTCVMTLGDMLETKSSEFGDAYAYGFIASHNDPNIEGLKWYCENVLPLVQKMCPQSRFYVAGAVCRAVPDYKDCIKLGRVEFVEDFYNKIRIAINPVRMGTGLNIKTIEAFAYGKPLVSTTVGCKGINSEDPVYICEDEPKKFAQAIVDLLKAEDKCIEMKKNAELFIQQYNEENVKKIDMIVNRKIEVLK